MAVIFFRALSLKRNKSYEKDMRLSDLRTRELEAISEEGTAGCVCVIVA